MEITTTEAGRAVLTHRDLCILRDGEGRLNGSVALGLLLDSQDKPEVWCLFWEWGGDWSTFTEADQNNAAALQGWEPQAVRDAIKEACDLCPDCVEDMEWFGDWADAADAALAAEGGEC